MAKDSSFDIVSELDVQEVDNAINQAQKEIGTRFDFKGTAAAVEFNRSDLTLTLTADQEPQLEAVRKVIAEKFIKRKVETSVMDPQKVEKASGDTVRQEVKLRSGIDKDTAKQITKKIKEIQNEQKLKVNAQIDGEQVRVKGAKRDHLQAVIAGLKASDIEVPLQFINFR